ncbi:MAG: alpha/beta fold hydrolase, partial [Pseudomonadota bacterium]|nr:alpha/beta fold hydrolase [Pseudomonadota bacterium]
MMAGLAWQDGATGFLQVAGRQIEYGMWGPAPGTGNEGSPDAAPTIVLLHEGLGCVALWRDFPQQLARATGCGVFAFSRPGYGQSDPKPLPWPLDYMTREAAETLAPVLDALAAPAVVLIGHSDGATIAAIHAGSVEDRRLWGVVLMAPHFFTEPEGLASIAEARTAYDSGDLRVRLGKYHRDPDNCVRGWNDSWLHPDFRDWNVSDCLDYIRVPVLVLQG